MMRILGCIYILFVGALLSDQCQAQPSTRDKLIVESLLRLDDVMVTGNEKLESAVKRYLNAVKGTPKYFEVIEKLKYQGSATDLLAIAMKTPLDSDSVKAAELLLEFDSEELLIANLHDSDTAIVNATIQALSRTTHAKTFEILKPLVTDIKLSRQVRSAAISGVGKNLRGQQYLLKLLETKQIPKELQFATGNALFASPDKSVREQATMFIKLPETAGKTPLPPVPVLAAKSGNESIGKTLFSNKATCAKCHKVKGQGKEVGPDLSEIGSKLSAQALYVSILDPSAGISHNYESYILVTAEGTVLTGIKVSDSATQITIKTAEAVERTFAKEDLEEVIKQPTSLMPEDLQKNLSAKDLVDLVEYLKTLKKAPVGVPSARP